MTNPDDPASGFEGPDRYSLGLTKREHFAALAMQGFCSDPNLTSAGAVQVAEWSVEQADALIAALNKETK